MAIDHNPNGCTYLLHDACLALREGDVSTRLVADELDLDLATLAVALLVIIVVVVRCAGAGTLNTAAFGSSRGAVASVVIEVGGRRLVVLVRDVGHCVVACITRGLKR